MQKRFAERLFTLILIFLFGFSEANYSFENYTWKEKEIDEEEVRENNEEGKSHFLTFAGKDKANGILNPVSIGSISDLGPNYQGSESDSFQSQKKLPIHPLLLPKTGFLLR